MSKLNNSRILLGILLLALFIIFCSLSIVLLVQPYFCNLAYVGVYKTDEYGFTIKSKTTITFEKYGRFRATQTMTRNGNRDKTYSDTGTYEFETRYSDGTYFQLEGYWSNLYYRNAFQLYYGDVTYTNIGAICLLIFYLLMSVASLTCAIILLKHCKNGKTVFGNVARMQTQIDEMKKQIDEMKKGE